MIWRLIFLAGLPAAALAQPLGDVLNTQVLSAQCRVVLHAPAGRSAGHDVSVQIRRAAPEVIARIEPGLPVAAHRADRTGDTVIFTLLAGDGSVAAASKPLRLRELCPYPMN